MSMIYSIIKLAISLTVISCLCVFGAIWFGVCGLLQGFMWGYSLGNDSAYFGTSDESKSSNWDL